MNRVLLTGATGFIGRHCVSPLLDAGFEVHGVYHRGAPEAGSAMRWHEADLLDPLQLQGLCREVKASHLLHLAWYAEPGHYRTGKQNLDWVAASLNLLREFTANGGGRAVLAGTCFEYDLNYGFCDERRTPTAPDTFYGECKDALHRIVTGYARQFGLSSAWARIFFLYGPFEPAPKLVASVIGNLLLDQPAPCSEGRVWRDYLHVADVAGALAALVASEVCGPVNIGSGQPVALRHIIQTIAAQTGNAANLRFGSVRSPENEPPLIVADARRLQREVGWQPVFSLESGIEQTVNWWRSRVAAPDVRPAISVFKEPSR
jgi:nucleoside-diphosphate-sugar epimerase